jgi:O-acetylhomoserine (thiol)-lyase
MAALEGESVPWRYPVDIPAIYTRESSTFAVSGKTSSLAPALRRHVRRVELFTQTLPKLAQGKFGSDPSKPADLKKLVDKDTRCVTSIAGQSPRTRARTSRRLARVAHELVLPVICDNTVLTPVLLRPFEHGIDITVYSCTKFIGGHGLHVGGCIVDSGKFDWTAEPAKWPEFTEPDPSYHGMVFAEALKPVGNISYILKCRTHFLRDMGSCMSPFAAFLFIQGLETLHLRMARHCENALKVARHQVEHPVVGLG